VTRKVLLGGIAGGVALFVWSVLAWTLLPLHRPSLGTLGAEARVVDALVDAGTPGGLYVIPGLPDLSGKSRAERAAALRDWENRIGRGPVATLVYRPLGHSPARMFRPLARGLVLAMAAALFSAFALSRARIANHLGRVAFVLGAGLFAWLLGPAMQWNWLAFPTGFTLRVLVDAMTGWAIVGVVQAGIVRPGPSGSPPA
jgi:hypothetical protein